MLKRNMILLWGWAILTQLLIGCTLKETMTAISLDDNWQFREVGKATWHNAQVPGEIHTDLLRAGLIEDPFYRDNETKLQWIGKTDWEYQTRFLLDTDFLQHENIELVCEGLDTYASVFLNDTLILEADNMFREWRADCKNLLKQGENLLRLHLRSPINEVLPRMEKLSYQLPAVNDHGEKTSPYTRKAPYHFGWDWGPRFVTCGIWQPVRLEAWNHARIVDLHIAQNQLTAQIAKLTAIVEARSTTTGEAKIKLHSANKAFKSITQTFALTPGSHTIPFDFAIQDPQLWWPNGYGEQPLYTIEAELFVHKKLADHAAKRIGLRSVELWQTPDDWGKSFEFVVNGIPVFAKGGNWIPADNFLNRVDAKRYEHLLRSVQAANMNTLRVWGGGIYENQKFYDLCDELGIMVWQDFMFACSMYPADEAFLASIAKEAIYQIKRLRHHPSLVLWCGNNEVEVAWQSWGWKEQLPANLWNDYLKIFHGVLPKVCAQYDPRRSYWPSSPSSNLENGANSPNSGDVHYWGVWHAAEPFTAYLQQTPRFMSEYGFQSFPQMSTVKKFTVPEDLALDSPVMVTHQKHARGNELIRTYMLQQYDEPKDFAAFLYVSQILQAEGIKLGTEHLRRLMPRCMGALYWQIDDCWPVASWSSMDYYGQWKALHYYARKFYSPILVSPHQEDGNIKVYIISDSREPKAAALKAMLLNFDGEILKEVRKSIWIRPLSSELYLSLPKDEWVPADKSANLFLLVELSAEGETLSTNTLFFKPPKELNLPAPKINLTVTPSKQGFKITLQSDKLAKNVYLTTEKYEGFFTDNYFHLIPGQKTELEFQTREKITPAEFEQSLTVRSLVEAFERKPSAQ